MSLVQLESGETPGPLDGADGINSHFFVYPVSSGVRERLSRHRRKQAGRTASLAKACVFAVFAHLHVFPLGTVRGR